MELKSCWCRDCLPLPRLYIHVPCLVFQGVAIVSLAGMVVFSLTMGHLHPPILWKASMIAFHFCTSSSLPRYMRKKVSCPGHVAIWRTSRAPKRVNNYCWLLTRTFFVRNWQKKSTKETSTVSTKESTTKNPQFWVNSLHSLAFSKVCKGHCCSCFQERFSSTSSSPPEQVPRDVRTKTPCSPARKRCSGSSLQYHPPPQPQHTSSQWMKSDSFSLTKNKQQDLGREAGLSP